MTSKKVSKKKSGKGQSEKKGWGIRLDQQELDLVNFCADSDDGREKLGSVHITKDYMEATDGSILVRLIYENPEGRNVPGEGIIVDLSGIRESMRVGSSVMLKGDLPCQAIAKTENWFVPVYKQEGDYKYPDTEGLIRSQKKISRSNKISFLFSVDRFKKIIDYAQKCGSSEIRVELTKAKNDEEYPPANISFYVEDEEKEVVCLLMPLRDFLRRD